MTANRKLWAGLTAMIAGSVTAISTARSSIGSSSPDLLELTQWIVSGNDLLASLAAIFAGLSGGYSIWQLFQRPAATLEDVGEIIDKQASDTNRQISHISEEIAAARSSSENRDSTIYRLLSGDLIARLKVALEAGALGATERAELVELLATSIQSHTAASRRVAVHFAAAVSNLAGSSDPLDRSRAYEAIDGDAVAAADSLMRGLGTSPAQAALRAKLAASLYAPFDTAKAIKASRAALARNPSDSLAWADLAAGYRRVREFAKAQTAARKAIKTAKDDWHRFVAEYEWAATLLELFDASAARTHLELASSYANAFSSKNSLTPADKRQLACFYLTLADVNAVTGHTKEGKRNSLDAIRIFRSLVKRYPRAKIYKEDLSWSLHRLSKAECELGRPDEARRLSDESITICNNLIANTPQDDFLLSNLGAIYNDRHKIELEGGENKQAFKYVELALLTLKRAVELNSSSRASQERLATAYGQMAEIRLDAGDMAAAEQFTLESLGIRSALARRYPSSHGYQYDCAIDYVLLAEISKAAGLLQNSLMWLKKAAPILERLNKLLPENSMISKAAANVVSELVVSRADWIASSRPEEQAG